MFKKFFNLKKLVFLLIISFYVGSAQALVNQDMQLWVQFFAQGRIADNILAFFEVQPRFDEDVSEFNTILLRTALGYSINNNVSVWQGYAWTPILNPQFRNEQRPFQQLLITNVFKNITLVNRTRLEQRFLQGTSTISLRARHLISVTLPIPKVNNWVAVLSDELFFNLNSTNNGPSAGFNQNRLYVGLGNQLTSSLNIQGGYMANYINASIISRRLNHVLLISCVLNF